MVVLPFSFMEWEQGLQEEGAQDIELYLGKCLLPRPSMSLKRITDHLGNRSGSSSL